MNKNVRMGIIIFTALIIGGIAYLALNQPEEKKEAEKQQAQSAQTSPADVSSNDSSARPASVQPGRYTDYNETAFASTTGERILFFHAPWCFQCREIEKDIKANLSEIPADVTIFKIDYDSNQDLRQKYGVKLQTSFVKFDHSGNVIQNFVAYDEPTFANLKKNIF